VKCNSCNSRMQKSQVYVMCRYFVADLHQSKQSNPGHVMYTSMISVMINTVRSPIRSLSNISLRRRQVVMSAGEPTINFDVAPGNIFIGSCLRVAEDGDK